MAVSDMDMMDMDVVEKKTNTNTKTQATTNTKCFKDPMYVIFLDALASLRSILFTDSLSH